jgi:hypothetical protein
VANTIPASIPVPDEGLLLAGQYLDAAGVLTLGEASNWAMAQAGSGAPRVLQLYPLRSASTQPGTETIAYTTNALKDVAAWRIPDTRGVTSVDCYIYAKSTTGAGEVEWRSSTALAVTGVQLIGAAWALHGPYALTIDATAGWDTITMYLDGNTDTIGFAAVLVQVPPLSGNIAAGITANGCVGIDSGELVSGESMASDTGRQIITNVTAIRTVPHVYWNWSALEDCVDGTTLVAHGANGMRMAAIPHMIPCVVWLDTTSNSWVLTVHVRATGIAAVTSSVVLHVCTESNPEYVATSTITVGIAAAVAWYTTTIQLPNDLRVIRSVREGSTQSAFLMVWPKPTAVVGLGNADAWISEHNGMLASDFSTASVNSVSVWGR